MRGPDEQTNGMFSYLSPEQRVRPDHPLRAIRRMGDVEVDCGAVDYGKSITRPIELSCPQRCPWADVARFSRRLTGCEGW
jgi:hypothetical protein